MSEQSKRDNLEKKVSELSGQVDELTKKIDGLNMKLSKVEASSDTLVTQTKALISSSDANKTSNLFKETITDPSGLIAKEMTRYLIMSLEKYQTTDFRRWLVTKGRGVAEKSIQSFVRSGVPQLKWYGATVTELGDKKYRYVNKAFFPFEVNSGMPLIGKVNLAQVVVEVEGDVDAETRQCSNMKCRFSSESPHKDVFESLEKDLVETLKPHTKAYGILSPLGNGLKRIYAILKTQKSFSVPLVLMILLTMLYPTMPPAIQILRALGLSPPWIWFLGLNLGSMTLGIVNGVIVGVVVWLALKYGFANKLGKTVNKVGSWSTRFSKKTEKPKESEVTNQPQK